MEEYNAWHLKCQEENKKSHSNSELVSMMVNCYRYLFWGCFYYRNTLSSLDLQQHHRVVEHLGVSNSGQLSNILAHFANVTRRLLS